MIIFKSINKLNKTLENTDNTGFVPTMGSIHKGHLSLIDKSIKICKKTLVSIYVNPKQFNNKKDFTNYPRNIKKDLKLLKQSNVDYVLLPKYSDIFNNKKKRDIKFLKISKILCAKYRPGHFEGVLTVIKSYLEKLKVSKLFLGEKDYQQLVLIKEFVKKFFKIKIIPCKTIRYKNTYALSSRNKRLKNNDFDKLVKISKIIKRFKYKVNKNLKYSKDIKNIKNKISSLGVKIEYLEIRNKNNLGKNYSKNNFKIFIAYYFKKIRFIDNI